MLTCVAVNLLGAVPAPEGDVVTDEHEMQDMSDTTVGVVGGGGRRMGSDVEVVAQLGREGVNDQ